MAINIITPRSYAKGTPFSPTFARRNFEGDTCRGLLTAANLKAGLEQPSVKIETYDGEIKEQDQANGSALSRTLPRYNPSGRFQIEHRGRIARCGRIWIDRNERPFDLKPSDAVMPRAFVHADPHPVDAGHKFIDIASPFDAQLPQRAERTGGNGRTRGQPGGGGLCDSQAPLLGGAPLSSKLREIYGRSDSEDEDIIVDGDVYDPRGSGLPGISHEYSRPKNIAGSPASSLESMGGTMWESSLIPVISGSGSSHLLSSTSMGLMSRVSDEPRERAVEKNSYKKRLKLQLPLH